MGKVSQNLPSAAVLIGALRVKFTNQKKLYGIQESHVLDRKISSNNLIGICYNVT